MQGTQNVVRHAKRMWYKEYCIRKSVASLDFHENCQPM